MISTCSSYSTTLSALQNIQVIQDVSFDLLRILDVQMGRGLPGEVVEQRQHGEQAAPGSLDIIPGKAAGYRLDEIRTRPFLEALTLQMEGRDRASESFAAW